MCINLPVKITSAENKKITVEIGGQKKEVLKSVPGLKVKKGDYVFLKDFFIIGKISKKEAKQIINLVKKI